MWQCKQCETKNDDQNRFCIICGAERNRYAEEQTELRPTEERVPFAVVGENDAKTVGSDVKPERTVLENGELRGASPIIKKRKGDEFRKTTKKGGAGKPRRPGLAKTVAVVCLLAAAIVAGSVFVDLHGTEKKHWISLGDVHLNMDGPLQGLVWDGGELFFFENGRAKSGWKTIDGNRYYFDTITGSAEIGWSEINGNRYYFDEKAMAANGFHVLHGEKYYFEDGEPYTGLRKIDEKYYYFSTNGKMETGRVSIDGETYYFSEDGTSAEGWKTIDGDTYYFLKKGRSATGWQMLADGKYHFGENGKLSDGWETVDGELLYFIDGMTANGWENVGGETYFFEDGVYNTGFYQEGSDWYYFDNMGIMLTGLREINGNWYAFGEDGAMLCDTEKEFGNYRYSFRWDGIATHYTYPVTNLSGQYISDTVQLESYDGRIWDVSYFSLDEPIIDCVEMSMSLEITETLRGSAKGLWGLYVWTTDGEWKLACEFNMSGTESEAKQTFKNPVSFYGYSFVLLRAKTDEAISYRSHSYLYDVRSIVYLT